MLDYERTDIEFMRQSTAESRRLLNFDYERTDHDRINQGI